MSTVRPHMVGRALESYAELCNVIGLLTDDEVTEALEIEHRSQRRKSILDRLVGRKITLYSITLKEKYHG